MYPESTVDARARQAYEDAEFRGRPLRRGRIAIAAEGITRLFLDSEELLHDAMLAIQGCKGREKRAGRRVRGLLSLSSKMRHTLERVSGSTSHMAFDAMMGKLMYSCRHKIRP